MNIHRDAFPAGQPGMGALPPPAGSLIAMPGAFFDPLTVVFDDQTGATDENTPANDCITNGAQGAHANKLPFTTQYSLRQYFRFARPVRRFNSIGIIASTAVGGFGRAARTHKLNLSFITNSNLDLNNVTWNNQGSLTYEDIAALTPLVEFTTPSGAATATVKMDNWQTPWGEYSLSSGDTMYGCRIMWEGDTAYSLGEEASSSAGGTTDIRIYIAPD